MSALPRPGDVLEDKVEIVREIGRGGFGAVYEALHRRTGRRVAVKVLRAEVATDAGASARFLQEALACGRVRHPNVIDILDASMANGQPYLVMELLEGETLAARIERAGPLSIAEALDVMAEVLAGVAAAHAAGIVHRDLKPDNVFLARSPTGATVVKVLDFGISKITEHDSFAVTAMALTGAGAVLGTPYYMSPEQARGLSDVDARSDVYSAGSVLFHALAGRPPFVATNYNALIAQILLDDPPALRALCPEVPESLERIVQQAMAKKREDRFATVTAFRDRIQRQTRVLTGVGILFTDLSGFNTFALEAPVEAVEEVLDEWERAHRAVVAKNGGTLRLIVGDEMLTTYPSTGDAVRAWLELSDPSTYAERARPQMRFHAGLSCGDIRIVRAATFGLVIDLAARMTSRVPEGSLAITPEALASLPDDLRAQLTVTPAIDSPRPATAGTVATAEALARASWVTRGASG